jgi:hypothetical protein
VQRLAFVIPVLLVSFAGLGCASETPAPQTEASPSVADGEGEKSAQAVAKAGPPKIVSDEAVFDFGKVKPKETVEHVFTIKNAGGSDLHIKGVQKT